MAHIHNKPGAAPHMMGMGSEMMKMGPGMMDMSKGMMGPGAMAMGSEMMKMPMSMMQMGGGATARKTAKVVVATGSNHAGRGFIGRLIRNPVVILGLGIAAGVVIYKYRNEIISKKSEPG